MKVSKWTKNGKDYWRCSVLLPPGPDGKRKRKWFYAAKRADALLKAKQFEAKAPLPADVSKLTLAQYVSQWLASMKSACDESSHDRYESLLRLHIVPYLGGMLLNQITPLHVMAFYTNHGASTETARYAGVVLTQALAAAVNLGLIHSNPAAAVRKPRRETSEIHPLDEQELQSLMAAAEGSRYLPLYMVIASTGMRRGEAFALTWDDIDLNRRKLSITKTLSRSGNRFCVKTPKTKASRRTIDLPMVAIDALLDQRKRLLAEGLASCELVFPNRRGKHLNAEGFMRHHFKPLLKRASLSSKVRIHDLRHSFATIALSRGVPVKVISEMMGHSNITTTLQTYSHVLPSMSRGAADALDAALGGGSFVGTNVGTAGLGDDAESPQTIKEKRLAGAV